MSVSTCRLAVEKAEERRRREEREALMNPEILRKQKEAENQVREAIHMCTCVHRLIYSFVFVYTYIHIFHFNLCVSLCIRVYL
jgi:hypothetical protein